MAFDKDSVSQIRKELTDILSKYGASKDIVFNIGNITYEDNSFRTTLKVANVANGHDPAEDEFAKYCWKFGLNPSAYGKVIMHRGEDYKICGIRPRARKYPVLLESLKTGEQKVCVMADYVNSKIIP